MSESSLKDKTVRGVGWSAVDNVTQYVVSFIVSIVLARLLSPDDYGLIGIISIFTAICTALINGGFGSALIRKKDADNDDFDTVFLINFGVSILLYTLIFLVAPLIARFFHRAELIALTRVSSLGIVIGALALVQQTILTKRIDFKTQTKITLIASILSGIIGIMMAYNGCGVWSLVAQSLASQLLRTILLWKYNRWLPRFSFSWYRFRSLFGFGWKILLSNLLNTVWIELYQVVVGKYYSPATLGQYTRAKQFAQMFSSNLTSVVQRVTYPVLSDLQNNKERMVAAYRRIIKMTMFITATCMFSLGAISTPLLYCLIGEKWLEAAKYLPLICLSMSLYPLNAINLNMLQVQGRSDLFLYIEIIKKVITLFPLVVGACVGIIPMLYTNVIIGIIAFFLNSYYSGRLLGYTSWMQIRDIAPSFFLATIIAVSIWFFKYIPISYWVILPIQIIVGVAVFLISVRIMDVDEYNELKRMVKPLLNKIRFHH